MKHIQTNFLNDWLRRKRVVQAGTQGMTLLEMIVVITILLILMGAAVPILKVAVRRQRELDFATRSVANAGSH